MAEPQTFEKITLILRDVFDDDDVVAIPQLSAQHVTGWDSLGHVRLLLEVEKTFRIRFSTTEISSLWGCPDSMDRYESQ
jgi:acyl carrier protein